MPGTVSQEFTGRPQQQLDGKTAGDSQQQKCLYFGGIGTPTV